MKQMVKSSDMQVYESALIQGDLSKLPAEQRINYYKTLCESLGLNPLTKPFEYLSFQGKTILYATRSATEQLRKIHGVSINIISRENVNGVYVVTARARTRDGREDESSGAVVLSHLKGDQLANAYMKAETKAKRRVTLSICGLGFMDESEAESMKSVKTVSAEDDLQMLEAPKKSKKEEKKKEPEPIDDIDDFLNELD